MLAVFSVFGAPRAVAAVGELPALGGAFALTSATLLAMAIGHASQGVLIAMVILAGAFLGVANTVLTQMVMEASPVPRPIASASYSFVRFTGGAIAPYLAGKLGEHVGVGVPFYVGAATVALAIGALYAYRDVLGAAPAAPADEPAAPRAEVPDAVAGTAVTVVAVGGPRARELARRALPAAERRGGPVRVVHVRETAVALDEAVDTESDAEARATLEACVAILSATGLPVGGEQLRAVGSHAAVAEALLRRADELDAGLIVLGQATRHGADALLAPSATARMAADSDRDLLILTDRAAPPERVAA